jgi:hypothetical protein
MRRALSCPLDPSMPRAGITISHRQQRLSSNSLLVAITPRPSSRPARRPRDRSRNEIVEGDRKAESGALKGRSVPRSSAFSCPALAPPNFPVLIWVVDAETAVA